MSYIVFNAQGGGTPGSDLRTLTGNTGGAISGDASYNINLVGAGAVTVSGSGNTLTITDGGASATQFDTDSGSAVPSSNNLDIFGSHGINTSGATNVVTVAIDNAITLGDLSDLTTNNALLCTTGSIALTAGNLDFPTTSATAGILRINSSNFLHAYGTFGNAFVGFGAGNFTQTGTGNCGFGNSTLSSVTSGTNNVGIGNLSSRSLLSASNTVSIGAGALGVLTTGNYNTALGSLALDSVTTGTNNIGIGLSGGGALTGSDSDNIIIGNTGTIGDNGKIIIGTNATHTSCYVAGIDAVNVGNVVRVVTEASDQLGTADITAGTGIGVAGTANVITISASSATPLSFPTDVGTATPAANALTMTGGTLIDTAGAGAVVTINAADAVVGSVSTDGSAATPTGNAFTIAGGTLITTAGAAATVTVNAADSVAASVVTDGGTATPASNSFSIVGGTNVTTSAAGSVVTINASPDLERNYTSVNTSPYVVLAADEYMGVDSSGGAIQINLPNAPSTGRVYTVKDSTGSASSFNITVTTVGGAVNIDGATTFVMNTDYQAVNLIFSGTAYEIY